LVALAFESASTCAWYCTGGCAPLGLANVCIGACSGLGGHASLVALALESASVCAWHGISSATVLVFARLLAQDWVAILVWFLWHLRLPRIALSNSISGRVPLGLRLQFVRALSVESSSSQASNRALIGNGARSSPLPIKLRIALRLATVLAHDWVATLLWSLWRSSLRRLVLGTALAVAHHLGWLMFALAVAHHLGWLMFASALAPDSVATLLWWLWHWSLLRFVLGMASAVQQCLSLQGCLLKTVWPYLFGFSGICVCVELCFPMASVVAYHLGLGCSLSARCQSSPLRVKRVKLRIAL
jgi:hypothetical protein